MKRRNKGKKKRLLIVGAISCVFVLAITMFLSLKPAYAAYSTRDADYVISSSAELISYSQAYANGERDPAHMITFSLSAGPTSAYKASTADGFISIGSDALPFAGKVTIAASSTDVFVLDSPLFGTMTTDVEIVYKPDGVNEQPREIQIARSSADVTNVPLLASKVVAGTNGGNEWKVRLVKDQYTDTLNHRAYNFSGVIGEVDESNGVCTVDIAFTHDSFITYDEDVRPAECVSTNVDLGLICGTLGAGCTLKADAKLGATMEGKTFSVTSTGANAGGIVGVMEKGSTVVMADEFCSICNVVSNNHYAGGIAAVATDGTVTVSDTVDEYFTVARTVSGNLGAGGLYGHYICEDNDVTIDLKNFHSSVTSPSAVDFVISRGTAAGGVIGRLDSDHNVTITDSSIDGSTTTVIDDNTFDRIVKFTGGTNRGGVIGTYSNSTLSNTLAFDNVKVKIAGNSSNSTVSAGALGNISDSGEGAVGNYVKFNGFRVETTNELSAGAVGDMGSKDSFVDFYGIFKTKGSLTSGLVNNMRSGVIRIRDITDLSETTVTRAQLVGARGDGLIYALGSGADSDNISGANNYWTFHRGGGDHDDVGDWGEVLRLHSSYNGVIGGSQTGKLVESDFFMVNSSAHTVTVSGISISDSTATIGSIKDFIKTALNIQLNETKTRVGALAFDSSSTKNTILGTKIKFTENVDLLHTGIVSLMRDSGYDQLPFSSELDGGNHIVKLAIGETYGIGSDGVVKTEADISYNNYGTSFRHYCLGLLARTENATVKDLKISGFISTAAPDNTAYNIGGLTATAGGDSNVLTLKNVRTSYVSSGSVTGNLEIKLYTNGNAEKGMIKCGAAVGIVRADTTGTFSIGGANAANDKCIFDAHITERKTSGEKSYVGGAIGYVQSKSNLTFNVNNVELGGTFDNTVSGSNNFTNVHYGGLIGGIIDNNGTFNRNLNIKNLAVTDAVSIVTKVNESDSRTAGAGAFIGHELLDTNVTIGTEGSEDGITVGVSTGPSINVPGTGSSNVNVGAITYKASGHWVVNHLDIVDMSISSGASSSSLGIIVNDGCPNSALYLDLYTPGYTVDEDVTINSNFSVFDEIVAFSKYNETEIYDNGQAIVSVRSSIPAGQTEPRLIMTGSACNTYQNQTAYGKGTVTTNPNTRYYYNLDIIRAKETKSDAEKMLLWSLNKYAANSLKKSAATNSFFNNNYNNTISGNCDMEGYSYYPVDASGLTISNATVKFYNDEIERGEIAGTGNSSDDGVSRSTRSTTQHYLMHEGILRNLSGTLTVNVLTLEGNVSNQHGGGSGFIVNEKLGGAETQTTATLNRITLAGARIDDRSSADYAPLLINTIGKNTSFSVSSLSLSSGSGSDMYSASNTAVAASSLIGDVGDGDTSTTNINLNFSAIKLDARKATGYLSDLNASTAYNTTRSIFDRATFLNSFRHNGNSIAIYNYEHSEDWSENQHAVTYAKEITTSQEYEDLQYNYYDHFGEGDYYTSPVSNHAGAEYDFSSPDIFLPHVYRGYHYNSDNSYHEVKVNVKDVDLDVGCGRYNHPYEISDGGMLSTASLIIYGEPANGIKVRLPNDLKTDYELGTDSVFSYSTTYNYKMWCNSCTSCSVYAYNDSTSTFVKESGDSSNLSVPLAVVREYLAGAYYQITSEITLPKDYKGLGAVKSGWHSATLYDGSTTGTDENDFTCQYAFHGVIVGSTDETNTYRLIHNKSINPLIQSSNGSVVKDIVIVVEPALDILLSQTTQDIFTYSGNSCSSYGAVISQVMGGDNIIDHVGVSFNTHITVDTVDTADTYPSRYARLVPVGGYIGVAVSGGVIFRNMSQSDIFDESLDIDFISGITASVNANVDDNSGWLYINPLIGRVISSYVFNETNAYSVSGTLENGTKNYVIPDLNPANSNKLKVNATDAANHVIEIPDAQALYILSCIVNSGAGSAQYDASSLSMYVSAGSDRDNLLFAYRDYTQTRLAAYSQVGRSDVHADFDLIYRENKDYDSSSKYGRDIDRYNDRKCVPYIIKQYTVSTVEATSGKYDARSICHTGSTVTSITLSYNTAGTSSTYDTPKGYRGIGNIYSNNSLLQLRFNVFDGDEATVKLNMQYLEYNHQSGISTASGNGAGKTELWDRNENYIPYEGAGFGMFNALYINSADSNNCVKDMTLSGKVYSDIIKLSDGSTIMYAYGFNDYKSETHYYPDVADRLEANTILHTGGLAGACGSNVYISNVSFSGLQVEGSKYVGGMLGFSSGKTVTIKTPSASVSGSNPALSLKVVAGFSAGGIIGGYETGNLTVEGPDDSISVINLTEINVKGYPSCAKVGTYEEAYNNMHHSAGGLCGYAKAGSSNTITVNNIEFRGGSITATHRDKRPSDMRYKIFAGGLIGRLEVSKVDVDNVNIYSVAFSANTCGGLIGLAYQNFTGTIDNVTVSGNSSSSHTTLDATNMAGGLIGYVWSNGKSVDLSMSSILVENYNIYSTGDAEKASAGGYIGIFNTASGNLKKFDISDSIIRDCNVNRNSLTVVSNDQKLLGIGGIVGAVADAGTLSGHNLLVDNVILTYTTGTNSRTPGMICGTNASSFVIKIVGISIQGGSSNVYNTVGMVGSNGSYGSGGYAVFADFNGAAIEKGGLETNTLNPTFDDFDTGPFYTISGGTATESANGTYVECVLYGSGKIGGNYYTYVGPNYTSLTSKNNIKRYNITGTTATESENGKFIRCSKVGDHYYRTALKADPDDPSPKLPYVTVNNAANIGNEHVLLTGDGISATVEGLPINTGIYTSSLYSFARSNLSGGSTFTSSTYYNGKLSTFTAEQGMSLDDNFAVLVVEDTDNNHTRDMINNYIRLLTNTSYNYTDDNDSVYLVNIYKVKYQDGAFSIVTDENGVPVEANLKRNGHTVNGTYTSRTGYFYMLNDSADTDSESSVGDTFSLIDVAYKDPANTKEVVYHLYVPVIVKKLLKYEFRIATASGTNYERLWYSNNNRFGKAVMENLGSPVTLYFEYDYKKTESEWQSTIDEGENLIRNYDKYLSFSKEGDLQTLPGDTILVLVDVNRGGVPYYAKFGGEGGAWADGKINLQAFVAADGTTHFDPLDFCDLLDVTATVHTASGTGKYVVDNAAGVEDGKSPTIKVDGVSYRLKDPLTDTDPVFGTTYDITIDYSGVTPSETVPLYERYYLSFFTELPDSTAFCHYSASCPDSFGDSSYPSRRSTEHDFVIESGKPIDRSGAHVVLGNIFVQSDTTLEATNDHPEMTPYDNDTLTATLKTTIQFDDEPLIVSEASTYIYAGSDIKVYQSFVVNLTKTENDSSSVKIITGDPTFYSYNNGTQDIYSNYTVEPLNGASEVTSVSNELYSSNVNDPAINSNSNYVEYVTRLDKVSVEEGESQRSLNEFLTTGGGAVITAEVVIHYDGNDSIISQFPSRKGTNGEIAGVTMSGTSNIGFDPSTTAFSKLAEEMTTIIGYDANEDPIPGNRTYYCLLDDEKAKLTYSAVGDAYSGDYGYLGINPLDSGGLTRIGVPTIAVHDISDIYEEYVKDTDYNIVRCYVQLYNKNTLDRKAYGNALNISDYLSNFTFPDFENDAGYHADLSDDTRYVFYFPMSLTNSLDVTSLVMPIEFTVITGSEFEGVNHIYSNYKVVLDVELVKSDGEGGYEALQRSRDTDYIVYTNARLLPDYIIG